MSRAFVGPPHPVQGGPNIYFQPEADAMPDDLPSFGVYCSIEAGRQDYPHIPPERWMRYTGRDIEDPTFMDMP
jgi:hypothetical protein